MADFLCKEHLREMKPEVRCPDQLTDFYDDVKRLICENAILSGELDKIKANLRRAYRWFNNEAHSAGLSDEKRRIMGGAFYALTEEFNLPKREELGLQ